MIFNVTNHQNLRQNRFLLAMMLFGFLQFFGSLVFADSTQHQLMRRLVVFPVKVDRALDKETTDVWWKIREELTKNRRFLVASRNFMIKKDVFLARGALSSADAIILGRLLDAQGLIVTYLEKRNLNMVAYEGASGRMLWSQSVRLHPSLPVSQQLQSSALKLIRDFVAAIPYQGFQIIDSLIGTPVFQKGDEKFSKLFIGLNSRVQEGDHVEWVRIKAITFDPLFQGGGQVSVIAEGSVVTVEEEVLTVRVDRVNEKFPIQDEDLVRLPNVYRRLQDELALKDEVEKRAYTHLVSSKMVQARRAPEEESSLVTSITFLANLAAFLLLAF